MGELKTVEVRAYVPSKDFALCKQFYQDFGFEPCLVIGWFSLLSERGFKLPPAEILQQGTRRQLHDAFAGRGRRRLVAPRSGPGIVSRYDVRAEPPADRPWGIRDFVIIDPTGVSWRIGQDIDEALAA
jgi:hypothetical protein